jgi:hypothetical protein
MSSNEALMKTLRLRALLSRGPNGARAGVDERRIARVRFMVPRRNLNGVGMWAAVHDWLLGACRGLVLTRDRGALTAVAATAVTPASCQPVSAH